MAARVKAASDLYSGHVSESQKQEGSKPVIEDIEEVRKLSELMSFIENFPEHMQSKEISAEIESMRITRPEVYAAAVRFLEQQTKISRRNRDGQGSTASVEQPHARARRSRPRQVGEIVSDMVNVPNQQLYHRFRQIMCDGDNFKKRDDSAYPTAVLDLTDGHGVVQLRPDLGDDEPLVPPEQAEALAEKMFAQAKELSDLDADALDILACSWLNHARDPRDSVRVSVDQLIQMRGIKPRRGGNGRRGGYTPQQRSEMLKAVSHLHNSWLEIGGHTIYQGSRRQKLDWQSRPFVITDRIGQRLLPVYGNNSMDVREFIFKPGTGFALFLLTFRQTALLSARALHYDPYRQVWEKRLTRYLSYLWRCRARDGDYSKPLKISTIFAEALQKEVNSRRQGRQQERLERAFDTLKSAGVISDWQYASNCESGDWKNSTITIEPPDVIRERYTPLSRRKKPPAGGGGRVVSGVVGDQVQAKRKMLGLSQLRLAEHLKISQALLSYVECGIKKAPRCVLDWLLK